MANNTSAKKKVTCFSCKTSYRLNMAKLPPGRTEVKCLKCGKPIPILDRVLKAKPDKPAEAAPAEVAAPAAQSGQEAGAREYNEMLAMQAIAAADEAEESEGEGWLAIYGDMMSLLLVFFVLLFAISSIDKVKFQTVMEAVSNALGGKIVYSEADKAAAKAQQMGQGVLQQLKQNANKEVNALNVLENQLSGLIQQDQMQQQFALKNEETGLALIGQDKAMFASGEAEIKEQVKPFLISVGRILKRSNQLAVVEGHTDNVPIRTAKFPSNWELSVARATNVVRFLIDKCGITPSKLSAAGYAYHRPRYSFSSKDNAKNRRIEIKIKKHFSSQMLKELGR
jgi:chemotaxis protein MotB